ncbi:MAG: orotidine-5'-phosphate decarboxylase [Anaerolineaceae bacterium]|jgi:orotidine-5'-phosphate decarboxylase
MMHEQSFADRLIENVKSKQSRVVVGLDTNFDEIPNFIKLEKSQRLGYTLEALCATIIDFNKRIIDAVVDNVIAIKPQIAYYEQYGHLGIRAFEETLDYAKKKQLLVISDAKRNDIGETTRAYSSGHIGKVKYWNDSTISSFDSDAITVNPYLGSDGILPFVEDAKLFRKGVFVLVRTSNPSAGEIQDLRTNSKRIYQVVAELVNRWNEGTEGAYGYGCVGAVVGATYPKEASLLRKLMPHVLFLVPGYGAQGATANDVVSCFNEGGLGAIVNSSRGIIFSYKKSPWSQKYTEEKFDDAARAASLDMKNSINSALKESNLL